MGVEVKTLPCLGRLGYCIVLAVSVMGSAQTPAPPANDTTVQAAQTVIGKSLFLRNFYSNNELKYDADGRIQGNPGVTDWTLAAVDVQRVERKGPAELELDGVRVAVRYNPDAHEFQRHPQKETAVHIVLADPKSAKGVENALGAIFSYGIDPALQRSMPEYWRHYFDPSQGWPNDGLGGQTIYLLFGQAGEPKDVTPPKPEHMAEPKFTAAAERDKVQGSVVMRVVVDATGTPRRVWLAAPLGYGLDQQAVDAVMKWKFTPAMRNGTAVPAGVLVEQKFVLQPAPPRR